MNTIVYAAFSNIYINLTNRCSNACNFCIRNGRSGVYGSNSLWLDNEPTADEVISALKLMPEFEGTKQVVFCGFGEPTYRIDEMVEIGKFLKSSGKIVRVNTNGQGNLINGCDITEKMKEAVHVVNVSLNASDSKKYQEICSSEFDTAYDELLSFAVKCQSLGLETILSVVDSIGEDEVAKCREIAKKHGLKLRVRELE